MTDPTYRDVAEWLPTDVREAIEATRPCVVGDQHLWRHERNEFQQFGSVFPVVVEWWSCNACRTFLTTDPEAYT